MTDIVIFGAGAMAEVIEVYLDRHSDYRIVGYTLDAAYRKEDRRHGLPVVDWEEIDQRFPPGSVKLLGPLTYQRMNTVRRDRYLEGKAKGYDFASFIHPGIWNYAESIGENVVILEQNTIQPFVTIGDNCIIWSSNHIGHHTVIGPHVFVAGHVGIAGNTTIGAESYLAGKAGVPHGITIGKGAAVLNGAFVQADLPDYAVIAGPSGEVRNFKSTKLHKLI
ncbi:acetyltransferase [Pseudoroseicyclus sp. H15]